MHKHHASTFATAPADLPGRLGQGKLTPFFTVTKASVLVARDATVIQKEICDNAESLRACVTALDDDERRQKLVTMPTKAEMLEKAPPLPMTTLY